MLQSSPRAVGAVGADGGDGDEALLERALRERERDEPLSFDSALRLCVGAGSSDAGFGSSPRTSWIGGGVTPRGSSGGGE